MINKVKKRGFERSGENILFLELISEELIIDDDCRIK
jgi:hypothetical protein